MTPVPSIDQWARANMQRLLPGNCQLPSEYRHDTENVHSDGLDWDESSVDLPYPSIAR